MSARAERLTPGQHAAMATLTPCTALNKHGEPCGNPGHPGLPVGVCEQHAIAIYRAVTKLLV